MVALKYKMEKNTLITELTQGKELTEQLKNHLNPAISSLETRQFLVEKIISSYEKALSLLNLGLRTSESSLPFTHGSPRSEISVLDCKGQPQKNVFRKRKTQGKWTKQVRVSSGTGLLDDGHCWRKYGQKEILGANFPRGYYRCTHRHSQGCLAIKQVQRSDEDPSTFEVTYRGRHTCVQAPNSAMPPFLSNETSKQNQDHPQQQSKRPRCEEKSILGTNDVLFDSERELLVKTENLDDIEDIFPSFSLPDAVFEKEYEENNHVGSVSSTRFISPATSESNYLTKSSCKFHNFGTCYNVQTPESEVNEIVSVTNSPVGDFDFSNLDFEDNFQFGNWELEFIA